MTPSWFLAFTSAPAQSSSSESRPFPGAKNSAAVVKVCTSASECSGASSDTGSDEASASVRKLHQQELELELERQRAAMAAEHHRQLMKAQTQQLHEIQALRAQLAEEQPMAYHREIAPALMRQARECAAEYLGASPANLSFVASASAGFYAVMRAISLPPSTERSIRRAGRAQSGGRQVRRACSARILVQTCPTRLASRYRASDRLFVSLRPVGRCWVGIGSQLESYLLHVLDEINRTTRRCVLTMLRQIMHMAVNGLAVAAD